MEKEQKPVKPSETDSQTLSIVTINVSGLHTIDKMNSLLIYSVLHRYDVIIFTETHLMYVTMKTFMNIFTDLDYSFYYDVFYLSLFFLISNVEMIKKNITEH